MNRSLRRSSVPLLVATLALTAGCGGSADKISATRADVAGAQAAAASAKAAIAALASKLSALTSTTPAPLASPATAPPAPTTTPAASPAATTGGLPAVPTGAALSSLLATPTTSAPAPPSSALSGLQASANAVLGGALSVLDVTKQCAAIPTAAVQALVKKPVGSASNFPGQCGWAGTTMHISLNLNDADGSSYKYLTGSGDHPVAGLGDVAEWSEPVPGMTLPDVNARKGKVTCYVQAPGEVTESTIAYTGKDPFFKISDAASQAYAALEEKLCADIFAATG